MANWRHWPKPVQLSASLMGGAVGLAVVYTLLAGTPKPVLPSSALFEPVSVEQTLSSSRPELSSFDFIFRPVFALNRTPPVQPDLPSEDEAALAAAAEAETVVVESIDGVNLLGIFGSGDVEGVIIRLDNGERQRVVVGESIKGWTLDSIESRRALLQAATGEEARLEMAYTTDQLPLAVEVDSDPAAGAAPETADAGAVNQSNGGPKQKTEPATPPTRMSFQNIYGGAPKQDTIKGQKGNE